ncbi:MAG: SH3 domain-containing protein [Desulfovibrio sp.]
MKRYTSTYVLLICLLASLALSGCAVRKQVQQPQVADLDLPQRTSAYLPKYEREVVKIAADDYAGMFRAFQKQYFSPWHSLEPEVSKEDAYWAKTFGEKEMYGLNYRLKKADEFSELIQYSDAESYPSKNICGIITRSTAVRALPSIEPLFYNPLQAGEGFPFDMLQNSLLYAGMPVLITHATKDGRWVFVEHGSSFGWINALDVATVSPDFMSHFEQDILLGFVNDNTPLYDKHGVFRGTGRVGMVLPIVRLNVDSSTVLYPLMDADSGSVFIEVNVPREAGRIIPLPPTPSSVSALADSIMGQLYGWGGLYELRDCSQTLQDIFRNMALELPRNSSQQAKMGYVIDFTGLATADKKAFIVKNGVPFFTMLYRKGHIMLYIGHIDGEPLIYHTMWGVKTKNSDGTAGRNVVGKTVVSTVSIGKELKNMPVENLLIEKIQSMQILLPQNKSSFCPYSQ